MLFKQGHRNYWRSKEGRGDPTVSLVLIFFRKCDIFIKMKFDFFYFGLIEGFEPKTCDVKVKKKKKEKKV